MTDFIKLEIAQAIIKVPVSTELRVFFTEQFVKNSRTEAQKRRYTTLMNLMKAAYQKGLEDGRISTPQ